MPNENEPTAALTETTDAGSVDLDRLVMPLRCPACDSNDCHRIDDEKAKCMSCDGIFFNPRQSHEEQQAA